MAKMHFIKVIKNPQTFAFHVVHYCNHVNSGKIIATFETETDAVPWAKNKANELGLDCLLEFKMPNLSSN